MGLNLLVMWLSTILEYGIIWVLIFWVDSWILQRLKQLFHAWQCTKLYYRGNHGSLIPCLILRFGCLVGLLDYWIILCLPTSLRFLLQRICDIEYVPIMIANRLCWKLKMGCYSFHVCLAFAKCLSFSWLTFSILFSPIMMIFAVVWIQFHFN